MNLKLREEFLEIIPLHDTTIGADILNALMEVLIEYNLSLKKLVCLSTDDAPAMTGILKGFVAKLKKNAKTR